MSYSEKELERQESKVRRSLFIVFVPILIMVLIISYYQSNSLEYNKKKYIERRAFEFRGVVIEKISKGDYIRAPKSIILDSYYEHRIDNEMYDKISIGDSVYKNAGSDSVYYIIQNKEEVIKDYNAFFREKYNNLERINNEH